MLSQEQTARPENRNAAKRVAYLMSRFPTINETFILYEILELERLGLQVEIFPLIRQRERITHSEAQPLVSRAHYTTVLSSEVLAAQLYWLRKHPRAYLRAWWRALRGNLRSGNFLVRAFVVVPQAALFARKALALGVEHIHAHWATHPTLAAYVMQQLSGLPYSFTAHAHDIYEDRTMLEEKIVNASFVVTISEYNRQLLRDEFGAEAADKTVVIHCGVDLSVFQPQEAVQTKREPFTMVCVASLRDYKGHPYLIDACAQLKAQNIDFRCLLVGEGEDRPEIEARIARAGLSNNFELLGHQPRSVVSKLVASADVVVLPSITTSYGKKEGIPVALMEALAVERPVVATRVSGIPELIEDGRTGLLVPERDAAALAAALQRLHANPELGRALGAAGRLKVIEEFDLKRSAAVLHRLLLHKWPVGSGFEPSSPYAASASHDGYKA